MQPDIQKMLEEQQKKIDAIYVSVEKTRKYFFWTMVITIVLFVLPIIGLAFAIPSFINTYSSQMNELGL